MISPGQALYSIVHHSGRAGQGRAERSGTAWSVETWWRRATHRPLTIQYCNQRGRNDKAQGQQGRHQHTAAAQQHSSAAKQSYVKTTRNPQSRPPAPIQISAREKPDARRAADATLHANVANVLLAGYCCTRESARGAAPSCTERHTVAHRAPVRARHSNHDQTK